MLSFNRDMDTDLEYVLQKEQPQKVCFGSGCEHGTSRKGMSPFMRYYTLEEHPNVSPNSYDVLESFKNIITKPCSHSISKKGYGGIARFGKDITYNKDYPSPLDYDISTFPKRINKSKSSVQFTSQRKIFESNKNPGPGMYKTIKKQDIQFEHSFGGRVKMRLGVDLKCCSLNRDTCKICGKKPFGDYWHLDKKVFLCRTCMIKEYQEQIKYKRRELKSFRKIRDCSDIHLHEGTDAKIWLMHPKSVVQWLHREAYLSAYIKD